MEMIFGSKCSQRTVFEGNKLKMKNEKFKNEECFVSPKRSDGEKNEEI
jgi:hypothetical protein